MAPAALAGWFGEIQRCLDQAASELHSSRSETRRPDAPLNQSVAQALAQAMGALRFAGCDGVARVLESAHHLTVQAGRPIDGLNLETLITIERALESVNDWLALARQGRPVPALALWSSYRALLLCQGETQADPSDLFDAPLRCGVPSEWSVSPLSEAQAAALRLALERGLLGLLREDSSPSTPSGLLAALARLAQAPGPEAQRDTWWLAAAVIDALRCNCLKPVPEVMRPMLRVLDRLRRHLRDGIDDLDGHSGHSGHSTGIDWTALQRTLLFLIAGSRPGAPWADRVRRDNALADWAPQVLASARLGQSDPQARAQALEAIVLAKTAWETVCGGDRPAMGGFGSALQRLDAALIRMPCSSLQTLSEGLLGLCRRLGERRGTLSEPVSLEVAGTLLFIEWVLRRREPSVADLDPRCEELRARIDPLPSNAETVPRWPAWLQDLARADQEADGQAAFGEALRATLRECEQVLEKFFHDPSRRDALGVALSRLMQSASALRVLDRDADAETLSVVAGRVRSWMAGDAQPEVSEQEEMVSRLGAITLVLQVPHRVVSTRLRRSPQAPGSAVGARAESLGDRAVPPEPTAPSGGRLDPVLLPVFRLEARRLIDQMQVVLESASSLEADHCARSESNSSEWMSALPRLVHTFRGSARTAGARDVDLILQEMETRLDAPGAEPAPAPGDLPWPEASPLAEIKRALARLRTALADLDRHERAWSGADAWESLAPDRPSGSPDSAPLTFTHLADRLHRVVRQASRDAARPALLVIDGEHTRLPPQLVAPLPELIGHLLRNAVAHGLETPEIRRLRGKPALGQILLKVASALGGLHLELSDDGQGPDLERIRERAMALGLTVGPEPEAVLPLMFHPGLSTADEISALAGRGIGLDAVRAQVHALGGQISLGVPADRGLTVTIRLPS
jgi:hypothetical protein